MSYQISGYAAAIPGALAGLIFSAFVSDICSRIMSRLINFFLSFRSNNKPRMFIARSLRITHSNNRENWTWVHERESRFVEVAELLKVWWLEITVRIRFDELLPETNYAAHLIFRTTPDSKGLDAFQVAMVSSGSLQWKKVVCLKPRVMRSRNKTIGLPVKRLDGWMELELGHIYCDDGTRDTEVAVSLMETDDENEKGGLIVAGIEVRPIENA